LSTETTTPERPPSDRERMALALATLAKDSASRDAVGLLASAAGIELPAELPIDRPEVDVDWPINRLGFELGRMMHRHSIYRRGADVVIIDPATGETETMDKVLFRSWVQSRCTTYKTMGKGARVEVTMAEATAAGVLRSHEFRNALPALAGVHHVRLPVVRDDGRLELLPVGYDPPTGIFTVEELAYDRDWDPDRAAIYLSEVLEHFPWGYEPDEAPPSTMRNRNAAVHVAAMVGMYCRAMFPPGTPRPMLLYVANQAGSGKTRLAQMTMCPVFGLPDSVDVPQSPEEWVKTLATEACAFSPYVFFDDAQNGLWSGPLNRFIVATSHSGRIMRSQDKFRVPNVSQVVATGQSLRLTPDLERRALICDLFLSGEVRGRRFPTVITERWLARPDTRSNMLSALWAMVRVWDEMSRPNGVPGAELWPPLESFEDWSSVVAAIVRTNGWADPLAPAKVPNVGDTEGAELRKLLVLAADNLDDELLKMEYSREELVDLARQHELLEDLVGGPGGPEMKPAEMSRWGKVLGRWLGRELVRSDGRAFVFGKRSSRSGRRYPLRLV